jgi:DNA mismatch repair protein MSH2
VAAQVGLAYCDNTLKVIGVVEFRDGDQLGKLEAALVRLGARECIKVEEKVGGAKAVESKKVKDVLQRCDVVLTERKSSDFNAKDIEQVCFREAVYMLRSACFTDSLQPALSL